VLISNVPLGKNVKEKSDNFEKNEIWQQRKIREGDEELNGEVIDQQEDMHQRDEVHIPKHDETTSSMKTGKEKSRQDSWEYKDFAK